VKVPFGILQELHFDLIGRILVVRFFGTHAQYDRIDAETV
jgi:mRNA-degrading endonuclease HigB of HigAB toxin-antitoxin module